MVGLAKRLKVRVLQDSTSEVYGEPEEHPQKESSWGRVNPIGPRACYDESKRCAEMLFFDYRRQHGLETRLLKIDLDAHGAGTARPGRVARQRPRRHRGRPRQW